MTFWYCEKCILLNGVDCGPWNDENEFFSNIKRIHKEHVGFKIGEPKAEPLAREIEKIFTDLFNKHINELYHQLICELKGTEKVNSIKDKWKWMGQT